MIFTWALDGLISFIFSKQTLVIKLCPTLSPLFVHVLVVSCPTLSPLFVHVLVVSCCSLYSITHLHVFSPCCGVRYDFTWERYSVRFDSHLFCREFMFYKCYLCLFTNTGFQHIIHVRWCPCLLTVTRRVSLMEQELLTLAHHLRSTPVFSGVRVAQSLACFVVLCR